MTENSPQQHLDNEFMQNRYALMGYINGLSQNPSIAEDIFQEVWLKLNAEIQKGTVIENCPGWCRTVAKNLVFEHWRRQKTAKVVFDSELVELVDNVFEEADREGVWKDRKWALKICMDQLPENGSRLMQLRHESLNSIDAIAGELKKSSSAVAVMLYRIRQGLEKCIEKQLKAEGL